jgi:predicted nucleic acid-binding protein
MGVDGLIIAEPRSSYATRSPIVVDCSVLAAIAFGEVQGELLSERLANHELHAPVLIDYEMANVAVSKLRSADRGQGDAKQSLVDVGMVEAVQAGLALFTDLKIHRHTVPPTAQWELALHHQLTAYDAAYLWVSHQLAAPLMTFDKRLGDAAQRLH